MSKLINAAVNATMQKVGYVQKQRAAPGSGLNYSFAGEAALIEALRPAMVEHGLFLVPDSIEPSTDTYTTKAGAVMNRSIVSVGYTLHHVSGECLRVAAMGEGSDVGDKSYPKAMTGALKYALRQLFLVETGDDPDASSSEPQARAAAKSTPAAKSAPVVDQTTGEVLEPTARMTMAQRNRLAQAMEAADRPVSIETARELLGDGCPDKIGLLTSQQADEIIALLEKDTKEVRK